MVLRFTYDASLFFPSLTYKSIVASQFTNINTRSRPRQNEIGAASLLFIILFLYSDYRFKFFYPLQPGEMRLITNDDMVCKNCVYAFEKNAIHQMYTRLKPGAVIDGNPCEHVTKNEEK